MVETQEMTNPFPGLRSFEPGESHLFFGREKQIDELLRKLRANRFLAIVGNSGSGKSSLVKTGLLPRLDAGFAALAGSKWRIALLRPGTDPLGNLAWSLSQRGVFHDRERMEPNYPLSIEQTLRGGSLGLVKALSQSEIGRGENLLIVIDQFEELFKFSSWERQSGEDRNDAFTFVNLLLNASRQKNIPIYIIITMRSDFLGESTEFRGLPEAINDGQFLIPRMKRHEIRKAITGPVEYMGVNISSRLVNRLLNDMGDSNDQLPILQHAMMRMWDKWAELGDPEIVLDIEHYEAIGTMERALSNHAEEAYNDLDTDEQRRICKKLFQALTDRGDDTRGTRRPSTLRDLSLVCEAPITDVVQVFEVFRMPGRSFLTGPPADELDGDSVLNISHESLMRVWNTLIYWIDEESRSAEFYNRLSAAAILESQKAASLWSQPELQLGLNWFENTKPNIHWARRYDDNYENAIDFLFRSKDAYELDETLEERERQNKLAKARRIARISFLAGFIFLILGLVAVRFYWDAEKAKDEAYLNSIRAERSADSARASAIEAFMAQLESVYQEQMANASRDSAEASARLAKIAQTRAQIEAENARIAEADALIQRDSARRASEEALRQQGIAEEATKTAREKERIAIQEKNRADRLSLLSTAQALAVKTLQIEDTIIKALVSKEAFEIHKMNTPNPLDRFDPYIHESLYEAVRTIEKEGFNRLDYQNGTHVGHTGPVSNMKLIKNDSRLISAGSDGRIYSWSPRKTKDFSPPRVINPNKTLVLYKEMDISPNEKWLVGGGEGKAIELYDLNDAEAKGPARVYDNAHDGREITSLIFLPGNKGFISAGEDLTLQKWHVDNDAPLSVSRISSRVRAMEVSSDGKYLYTGDDLGRVQIWDLSQSDFKPDPNFYSLRPGGISSLQFSPNDRYLAIGRTDGILTLYTNSNPGRLINGDFSNYEGHRARISSIAFSSDGSMIATGSFDRTVRLWITQKLISRDAKYQPMVFRDHLGWVMSVSFLTGRGEVLAGCNNGDIKIWQIDTQVLADAICASQKVPRTLTTEEWDKFIGDIPNRDLLKTCPGKPFGDFFKQGQIGN